MKKDSLIGKMIAKLGSNKKYKRILKSATVVGLTTASMLSCMGAFSHLAFMANDQIMKESWANRLKGSIGDNEATYLEESIEEVNDKRLKNSLIITANSVIFGASTVGAIIKHSKNCKEDDEEFEAELQRLREEQRGY